MPWHVRPSGVAFSITAGSGHAAACPYNLSQGGGGWGAWGLDAPEGAWGEGGVEFAHGEEVEGYGYDAEGYAEGRIGVVEEGYDEEGEDYEGDDYAVDEHGLSSYA